MIPKHLPFAFGCARRSTRRSCSTNACGGSRTTRAAIRRARKRRATGVEYMVCVFLCLKDLEESVNKARA